MIIFVLFNVGYCSERGNVEILVIVLFVMGFVRLEIENYVVEVGKFIDVYISLFFLEL